MPANATKDWRAIPLIGRIVVAILSCGIFLFSIEFAPYHRFGDQAYYRQAYEIVRGLPLGDALNAYRSVINSFELVHFFICWIGSNAGVSKDVLMAFFNAVLGASCAIFLYRRTGKLGLTLLLSVSCYYLFAMFLTLEKLKLAFTFFMLFLLGNKRRKWPWVCLIISIFTHFQMVIVVGAIIVGNAFESPRVKRKGLRILVMVIVIAIAMAIGIRFWPYIVSKASYYLMYADKPTISDWILICSLMSITICFTKRRRFAISFFLFMFVAVFFLGGTRLDMFFYFAFLGLVDFKRKPSRLFAYISVPFFLVKLIAYLEMVVRAGG
jgi:hypothetical protein